MATGAGPSTGLTDGSSGPRPATLAAGAGGHEAHLSGETPRARHAARRRLHAVLDELLLNGG
ncbi:hypothetical protein Mx9_p98 [Myxococcus phage Mx9]|nr:hypothetical protein Mx9_p98 [Myxococcus phage Mx9]